MNIKYSVIIVVAALMVLATGCADDELKPILTFDQLGKGAYARLISESPRELDLANLGSAQYIYDIDFVDLEGGSLVSQYNIDVQFLDNNPDNGDDSAGPLTLKSFSSSEFSPSTRGNLGLSGVTITLNELLSLFGLNADNLIANDRFRILGSVTLQDGSTYSASNSSAAVNGDAFQGHFRFDLTATCPLSDNLYVGDYTLSYDDVAGAWDESIVPGTVTLRTVSGSTTKRQFDAKFLALFGDFDVSPVIEFLCDQVIFNTVDSGVGCAGTSIILEQAEGNPVDINDPNAVLILNYVENTTGCENGTPTRIMRLTKN